MLFIARALSHQDLALFFLPAGQQNPPDSPAKMLTPSEAGLFSCRTGLCE